MAQKSVTGKRKRGADAHDSPLAPKKRPMMPASARVAPSHSLPADPSDTPYTLKLARLTGGAFELSIKPAWKPPRWRYDAIEGYGYTWHRGDIGEVPVAGQGLGRFLILDMMQETAHEDADAIDTYFAIAWLYTEQDANEEGHNMALGPGKTHIVSTNVQVLRYGGFHRGPMHVWQRKREVVDDQILDFTVRPPSVRPLAGRGCDVAKAIRFYRTRVAAVRANVVPGASNHCNTPDRQNKPNTKAKLQKKANAPPPSTPPMDDPTASSDGAPATVEKSNKRMSVFGVNAIRSIFGSFT